MNSEVSKLHPGMVVIINRAQDPFEFHTGKVIECLMTKSGDFIHLVRVLYDQYAMYEEHELKDAK